MKKKNLFLGVLLASAVFSLAACNNKANNTESGEKTTESPTPTGDTPTESTTGDVTPTGQEDPKQDLKVASLSVNTFDAQVFYTTENLTTEGIVVTATMEDGETRVLDKEEYKVTHNFVKKQVGDYQVTITVGNVSTSYTVFVRDEDYSDYKAITNVEEFNNFRYLEASSKKFMLMADIDLEGVELQGTKNIFSGTFDGQGHTISNAVYRENAGNKSGILVRELSSGANVTNIKFANCIAELNGETIGVIAGMANDIVNVSKIEFNNCVAHCNNYPGLITGRTNTTATKLTISEITAKNGTYTQAMSYGGTLIGDIAAGASATSRAEVNISDCDLDIEFKGGNKNGGFLSGRIRNNTNLNIKNVLIRNAVLSEGVGLVCGGGDNNAGNSTVTVENLYVQNTNATVLQSCAVKNATSPVTTFSISYTNSYINSSVTSVTDNETTYLQAVDGTTTNLAWMKDTLKLDFSENGSWIVEQNDATKFRLAASSTNVRTPQSTIKDIKLVTANAVMRFTKGSAFATTGLAVIAIYSDGVNLPISTSGDDGYLVDSSKYDASKPGEYEITITSKEDSSIKKTYKVVVAEQLGIKVDTQYAKLAYMVGDEIDLTNLLVYADWSDGQLDKLVNEKDKTPVYTTNVDEIDMSTPGSKEIVITQAGFDPVKFNISVAATKPVVVDNYAYINVDASADIEFGGEKVNGVETFNTVADAVNYLVSTGLDADVNKVIYVADGTYHEKITIPASLKNLSIIGQSQEKTIIEYDAVEDTIDPLTGDRMVMNCATLHVNAEGFGLENITVRNSFDYMHHNTDYANPQGFALTIAADGAVINDVTLYGNQDTLFFKKGRVYLSNSKIMGNIDFIFGENDGIAFFDKCTITAVGKSETPVNNNGYVTAMKGDANNYPTYGYVFNECTFDDDGNVLDGAMSLGRPWGAGASVTYINCSFTAAYSTLAYDGKAKSRWFDMSGNSPLNAHFAEYGSTGAGKITEAVAGGKLLTQEEAANYTLANTMANTNGGVKWGSSFDYATNMANLKAAESKVKATDILVLLDGTTVTDSMSVAKDDTSNLVSTATEWNADNKKVTVSIGDPTLATYADGKITGLAIGETTVTFTLGDVTKTVNLSVIELPSFDVTFVVPEGATAVAAQSIKKNKKLEEPTAPTLTGSVFKGWFTDAEFKNEYDFNTPVTSEVTLYARFVKWADLTKENCVYYFNGTQGDGVDTFGDGINIQKKEGTWYSISVGGDTSANKIQSRWNNSDPTKVNPDTQFNKKTTLSFAVEKNATVTITFRNVNGALILFKFNGETITPTASEDGLTYIYEATTAGVFMMENNGDSAVGAVKDSYLSSISVTYPEVISESTQINFGTTGNYEEVLALDDSEAKYAEIKDKHNQITGKLVFYVVPGSSIIISGNWAIDFTINGGDRIQSANAGGSYGSTNYEYVSETGGKIVIEAQSNKNYFYSISVVTPTKMTQSTKIQFGTSGNAATTLIDGVKMSGVTNRDAGDAQIKNGKITLTLEKAATITIAGNWAVDYTINGTVVQSKEVTGNEADQANLNYEYKASAGTVEIVVGDTSKCYFYYIDVVME